jgi:hypothetical protein
MRMWIDALKAKLFWDKTDQGKIYHKVVQQNGSNVSILISKSKNLISGWKLRFL